MGKLKCFFHFAHSFSMQDMLLSSLKHHQTDGRKNIVDSGLPLKADLDSPLALLVFFHN